VNPAERILEALARHLRGEAHVRLLGGAALVLGYGLDRTTEDADLLLDDAEMRLLIEEADFGAAIEATNHELEPEGLYVTHIWGPSQQILTPEWRSSCRPVHRDWPGGRLRISVLGPLDLVLSKLCRADDGDLDDIRFLIDHEHLDRTAVEEGMQRAGVPEEFRDVFSEHCQRVLSLFELPSRR
jgi:hypothetical protein